jgi:Tol biopolymer transport system component
MAPRPSVWERATAAIFPPTANGPSPFFPGRLRRLRFFRRARANLGTYPSPESSASTATIRAFFPDGKRIWFSGAEAGHSARTYAQQITGGTPQPITPEGIFADGVSPDGKLVIAPDPDGRLALFPVDGSASRLVPAINPGQRFVQWSEDGKSIYVRGDGMPISISKVDLSTGKQSPFLHLMPADPSGVAGVNSVVLSRDAKSYAYNYRRLLSELMVVEGLK